LTVELEEEGEKEGNEIMKHLFYCLITPTGNLVVVRLRSRPMSYERHGHRVGVSQRGSDSKYKRKRSLFELI
jgi:hypothetical protein